MTDEDESDDVQVPFGEFVRLVGWAPAMRERLMQADNVRAETMLFFATSPGGIMAWHALEALVDYVEPLAEWASASERSPYAELTERVLNDLMDAIDGILSLREATVMDACRDLMELAVLVRDFIEQPQRMAKWMRIAENERAREFGFNKLLRKYDQQLPFMGSSQDRNSYEYMYHSRTLHPAMWVHAPQQLTRGVMSAHPAEIPLLMYSWEICRHGGCVALMLLRWLDNMSEPKPEGALDLPPDDWAVSAWLDRKNEFMEEHFGEEGRNRLQEEAKKYEQKRPSASEEPSS